MDAKGFVLRTKIVCERQGVRRTGALTGDVGVGKALVVTDPGIAAAGVLDQVLASLKESSIAVNVFDAVEPNPTMQAVDSAAEQYAVTKCDGIVAVGGGSAMDTGKSVAVLATNAGSASDYVGNDKVAKPCAPIVCIPTTAGTAAEITDVAVLSDRKKKIKTGLRSPYVAPTLALLDPCLTVSLPPGPTRESGLDALTHAVESYICVNAWSATDALALRSIELIGHHLRRATHYGKDIEAREGMLTASLLAGMAFHNTLLCLVHAITGPLGGMYNLPHGAANAIVLPHAMRFLLPGALLKYRNIAAALGARIRGLGEREAAEQAVDAVVQLAQDVGLTQGLAAYGVQEDDLPQIAETVAGSYMIPLSPRAATAPEIIEVCRAAL